MNLAIVFDTETTGLPDWKSPSEAPHQPNIVQLAANLIDLNDRKILQSMDVIVKPDGWVIPQECIDVHGISNELAHDIGIPEKIAVEMFLEMWAKRKRIAYNTTFDNRIIRIATKRYFTESVQNEWHAGEYECAMMMTTKVIGGKYPKLDDAYQHFFGKKPVRTHSAMSDAKACQDVYFAAKDVLAGAA